MRKSYWAYVIFVGILTAGFAENFGYAVYNWQWWALVFGLNFISSLILSWREYEINNAEYKEKDRYYQNEGKAETNG